VRFAIREYLLLLRPRHWVKNVLIFVPLFFDLSAASSGAPGTAAQRLSLSPEAALLAVAYGFAAFSLLSSAVYILNDIRDRKRDRLHSVKRLRPIASGAVSVRAAFALLSVLLSGVCALVLSARAGGTPVFNKTARAVTAVYFAINAAYSFGLKNIPLVDVVILASGYVLRVLFGAALIGVEVSVWLYLVISTGAFYLGLGKRRNEITQESGETRKVMRFYSHNFLDKNMYVCQTLCVAFYALWSIDPATIQRFNTRAFVYTIPLILIILLKYSLNVETDSDGDPTSVVLHDRTLMLLCMVYVICAFCILYVNRSTL
jgi:4-hydroxybenzoate polyprenyltransferase